MFSLKKIILSLCVAGLVSTGASAAGKEKGSFGASVGSLSGSVSTQEDASVELSAGYSYGAEFKYESRFVRTSHGGLYAGLGISYDFINTDVEELNNGYSDTYSVDGYSLDLYGITSYDFYDLSLNALLGYSHGELGVLEFDGVTYGFGAEYSINKSFSLGLSHKITEVLALSSNVGTVADNVDVSLSRTQFKFMYKF